MSVLSAQLSLADPYYMIIQARGEGCGVFMCQLPRSNDIVNVHIAGNKVQPNDLLTPVTWLQ